MGLLVKGQWHNDWYDTKSTGGEFVRQDSQFRGSITAQGEGDSFKAEVGRYHLFVSLACPWAHRTLIFRKLKQLEDVISVSIVKPEMVNHGWELDDSTDVPVDNVDYLYQVYLAANRNYTGRVTVPVLWDKKTETIVNNESSEIIRLLNESFNAFTDIKTDYYPLALRDKIDEMNRFIYGAINNGVYKAGFATTQSAYEKAFNSLFSALDELEETLSHQRYLVGEQLTEADWRLFTTLIRFDTVYYSHFKTNLRRIEDYPNLANYVRDLYQQPGIADTVNFQHIKTHYYFSHDTINPTRIIPVGPEINYQSPHNRDRFRQTITDSSD